MRNPHEPRFDEMIGTEGGTRVTRWRQWWTRDVLIVVVPLVAVVVVTFLVASRYVQPAPPDRLVMATGAAGGAYQKYGEQYREHLAKFGVTLGFAARMAPPRISRCFGMDALTSRSCRAASDARCRE